MWTRDQGLVESREAMAWKGWMEEEPGGTKRKPEEPQKPRNSSLFIFSTIKNKKVNYSSGKKYNFSDYSEKTFLSYICRI